MIETTEDLETMLAGTGLPLLEVGDQLCALLMQHTELVLEAPPGAGKTTAVPLLLLYAQWRNGGRIIVLQPRRVAARAAAARMAALLGEPLGRRVGYRVRGDRKVSDKTVIEVVTEGVMLRMLQSDPELRGISAVLFDEFHQRQLDSDLALALTLQAREVFRSEPLRIVIMSATLTGIDLGKVLPAVPVVRSQGRAFPVDVHYASTTPSADEIVAPVAALVRECARQLDGETLLVFLPGRREIEAVRGALGSMPGIAVDSLHGGLDLRAQNAIIERSAAGCTMVVLATNVAETSLTLAGVTVVIDSGLERRSRFDPGNGLSRLQLVRISKASAHQRAGRAGRVAAGLCYRLWTEEIHGRLQEQAAPEICEADLAAMMLQLLSWGVADPAELSWLDRPAVAAVSQAVDLLDGVGAIEHGAAAGLQLSEFGEKLSQLPLHPRLGAMLLWGSRLGHKHLASNIAAILSEGSLPREANGDLDEAIELLSTVAGHPSLQGWRNRVLRASRQYSSLAGETDRGEERPCSVAVLVASAYPDRIARQRSAGLFSLAGGRAARLPEHHRLSHSEWLAVAELGGESGRSDDRVYSAARLKLDDLLAFKPGLVHSKQVLLWQEDGDRLVAKRQECLGALVLREHMLADFDSRRAADLRLQRATRNTLSDLPWTESLRQLQTRVCLLNTELGEPWPDLSDAALLADAERWLAPWLTAMNSRRDLQRIDLRGALLALLPWPMLQDLDRLAPLAVEVPSGRRVALDYSVWPPVLAVKLQEMFGCDQCPSLVGGRVVVQVHLLSPAGRVLQVTQDLHGFWRGAYQQVRNEMRGRYPKHPWPEDPLQATASRGTRHRRGSQ